MEQERTAILQRMEKTLRANFSLEKHPMLKADLTESMDIKRDLGFGIFKKYELIALVENEFQLVIPENKENSFDQISDYINYIIEWQKNYGP